jgi:hypothetical protein
VERRRRLRPGLHRLFVSLIESEERPVKCRFPIHINLLSLLVATRAPARRFGAIPLRSFRTDVLRAQSRMDVGCGHIRHLHSFTWPGS